MKMKEDSSLKQQRRCAFLPDLYHSLYSIHFEFYLLTETTKPLGEGDSL